MCRLLDIDINNCKIQLFIIIIYISLLFYFFEVYNTTHIEIKINTFNKLSKEKKPLLIENIVFIVNNPNIIKIP